MKIFFWFCLCCGSFLAAPLCADDDEPDTKASPKSTLTAGGHAVIVLDKATQAAAGLKTISIKPVNYRPELLSYGTAISIEPLLALQHQYLNALTQQSSAQAKARFTQTNANRLNYLHQEGIVSSRALQDQQTTLQTDNATLASSHYLSQQIVNNAQLLWGAKLTDWLVKASREFSDLTQQRRTLLKITFPAESNLSHNLQTIFVAPNAHREQAVAAQLISAVPQTDNFSQGQQYFYQTPAKQITAGMRLNAWIPSQQQAQSGIIIPESALIWHLGQALIFVKIAEQQFSQRPISTYRKVAGGYFVTLPLKTGEQVVSVGAQMLLSQQFRGQIPSEDDD